MLRLHYADSSLVTADEIAEAVMQYARALAERGTSDLVTIPILDDIGNLGESTLVIGPASQLFTTPIEGRWPEASATEVAVKLVEKAKRLRADPEAKPEPLEERDPIYDDEYFEHHHQPG